jgi:uncharacterized protein YggU (UPF0235/DUF167 family)
MIIEIKVKPKSSQDKIIQVGPNVYQAMVRAVPENNQANEAVCRLVADHFGVAFSRVFVVSGKTSSHKLIDVAWTK